MQSRETNSHPLGLCRKLLNFIMDSFIGQSLKRITMRHSPPSDHESDELLIEIEDSSSINEHQICNFESELMIEFNHDNGLEKWTHYNEGMEKKDETKENIQAGPGTARKKKKGKEIEIPKKPNPSEENEMDHMMSTRRVFLNNINEKSEVFIRKKKEALRKSISLDVSQS